MLRERKSDWPFIIYYIVLFFIVVGAFIYIFNDKDEFEPAPKIETQEQYEDVEAYIDAQAVVKQHLLTPSTADFPSSSKASIHRDGDNFRISSYVDYENAFGANIRSDWTVEFQSRGDMIAISSVVINGKQVR